MIFNSKNSVDSRVVELTFNNQQFETNAKQSLSTLDRLKQALDFSKTKDVFGNIASGLKSVDVSVLSKGIQQVQASFSALDVVAMRVLTNITDGVYNATKNFVSSVTIDQASAGWDKYAEKTSAVQTIMAATAKDFTDTGEQMEFVNSQLEKLNWFTDETSYNFLDMVNNIGKFTSNNVSLDTSVTAMEGISVWAAKSGANVEEAGRAMYNLSQAIAVGSVKLQDWKSIENANMATAEFKETAIQTAEELGTLKKAGDGLWKTLDGKGEVSVSNFNAELSKGWFTSEVLLQTLSKYGDFTQGLSDLMDQVSGSTTTSRMLEYIEQYKQGTLDLAEASKETGIASAQLEESLKTLSSSDMEFGRSAFAAAQEAKTFQEAVDSVKDAVSTGWMNTFELMFGDYLEAKNLWTELANDLYDIFAEGGNVRNELIQEAFSKESAIDKADWDKLESSGMASPDFISAVRKAAQKHDDYAKLMVSDEEWLAVALEHNRLNVSDLEEAYESLFGTIEVNEGIKSAIEDAKETDETFKKLYDTLEQYDETDISKVIFGDGSYVEGEEELEKALDSMLKTLDLTQDQGNEFVEVLKSMGLFGGEAADSLADLSVKELKNQGYTDAEIKKIKQATANGKELKGVIDEIINDNPSVDEMWTSTLYNAMEALVDIFGVAQEAWAEVFPPMTSDTITDIVTALYNASNSLLDVVNNSNAVHDAFTGIFNVLAIILEVGRQVVHGVFEVLSAVLEGLGIDLGDAVSSLSEMIANFRAWLTETQPIQKAFHVIATVAGHVASGVRSMVDAFMKIPFVRNTISNFKVGFKQAFGSIGDFFDGLSPAIDSFVEQIGGLDGLSLENIQSAFEIFKSTILDYFLNFPGFEGLRNAFKALGNDIVNSLQEALNSLWDYLEGLREKLDGTLAGSILGFVLDTMTKIKEAFTGNNKEMEEGAAETVNIFEQFQNGLNQFMMYLTNIDWGVVAKLALGIFGVSRVIKLIKKLATGKGTILGNFRDMLGNISGTFEALQDRLKDSKSKKFLRTLAIVSLCIGILAGCVIKLSSIPLPDIIKGTVVVAALGAMLVGLTYLLGKMDKSENVGKAKGGGTMLLMALAVKILAGVVKSVAEIPLGDVVKGTLVVAALGGMLVGFIYLLGRISGSENTGKIAGGGTMIMMVIAIKLLAGVVKSLADIPLGDAVKGTVIVAVLGGLLVGLIYLLGLANGSAKTGKLSGGMTMIMMVLAIKLLASVVKSVAEIPLADAIKGTVIVTVLGALLAGLAWLLGKTKTGVFKAMSLILMAAAIAIMANIVKGLSEITVADAIKGTVIVAVLGALLAGLAWLLGKTKTGVFKAVSLVLIAAAVAILAQVVKQLAEIQDVAALQNAVMAIAILGVCLAGIAGILGKTNTGILKATSLVLIAASIAILAVVAKMLSDLDPDGLQNAIVAIALMSVCLVGVAYLLGKADVGVMKAVSLIIIAASIATLAAAMAGLAQIKASRLRNAEIAMGVLAGIMAGLMIVAKFAGTDAKSIGGIATIAGAVSGIATALGVLAKCDPENLLAASLALSLVSGMFAILMITAKAAGKASASIFILVGAMGAIALVLGLLATFTDADKVLKTAEALTLVMLSLAVLMGALTLVGMAGPAVYAGMTALGILVGAFSILAVVFGAINELTGGGFGNMVQAGIDILINIGEGIGRFFGALVGGFADQAMSYLPSIAESLTGFVQGLQPLNDVKGINFGPLMDALLAITAVSFTELLTAIPNLVSELATGKSAVAQFADDLTDLATGLSAWSTVMDGMGEIKIPSEAISRLSDEITKVSWTEFFSAIGGLLTFGYGQNASASEAFANDLESMSSGLKTWADTMTDIGEITVPSQAIADLSLAIGEISISEFMGAISSFATEITTGKSQMEQFEDDTGLLATSLVEWSGKMDELGDVDVPLDAINDLTTAIDSIPSTGLFEAIGNFISGSNKVEGFADNLGYLAGGLVAFQESLGEEFDSAKLSSTSEAITTLGQLGTVLKGQNFGGLLSSSDYEKFGSALTALGTPLQEFSHINIDTATLTAVAEGARGIAEAVSTMSAVDISDSDLTDTISISNFKQSIETLADAISGLSGVNTSGVGAFSDAVKTLSGMDISGAINKLNAGALTQSLDTSESSGAGEEMGSALAEGMSSQTGAMTDAVGSLTTAALSEAASKASDFTAKGLELVKSLAEGIKSGVTDISSAFASVVSTAASGIDTSKAREAGGFFTQGFAKGITDHDFYAVANARAMALKALEAAKKAINSNSPSKETYKIGTWFVQGFANAIRDLSPLSSDASREMGTSAVEKAKWATNAVRDILTDDIDAQPTITPVLDLSDIESGAGSISKIFGNTPIALTSNIGAITSNISRRRSSATTDDLVEAITGLGRDVISTTGDTYIVNGVTYDDGSNITDAVRTLVHAVKVGGRA